MNDDRIRRVAFIDAKLLAAFNALKSGRFEDKQLAQELDSAIDKLKQDPFCGVQIAQRLWPKEYVRRYGINNLRKYDLKDGWRLMYTLTNTKIAIISILLEWLDHKSYEKRFGYKSR